MDVRLKSLESKQIRRGLARTSLVHMLLGMIVLTGACGPHKKDRKVMDGESTTKSFFNQMKGRYTALNKKSELEFSPNQLIFTQDVSKTLPHGELIQCRIVTQWKVLEVRRLTEAKNTIRYGHLSLRLLQGLWGGYLVLTNKSTIVSNGQLEFSDSGTEHEHRREPQPRQACLEQASSLTYDSGAISGTEIFPLGLWNAESLTLQRGKNIQAHQLFVKSELESLRLSPDYLSLLLASQAKSTQTEASIFTKLTLPPSPSGQNQSTGYRMTWFPETRIFHIFKKRETDNSQQPNECLAMSGSFREAILNLDDENVELRLDRLPPPDDSDPKCAATRRETVTSKENEPIILRFTPTLFLAPQEVSDLLDIEIVEAADGGLTKAQD